MQILKILETIYSSLFIIPSRAQQATKDTSGSSQIGTPRHGGTQTTTTVQTTLSVKTCRVPPNRWQKQ